MSETREEQIRLLRETINVRSVWDHEIRNSLGFETSDTKYTKALIAALHAFEVLPELLEACKEAEGFFRRQCITCRARSMVQAAIAKAEGK